MNERIKIMWVAATGSMWPRPYKFTAGEYDTHLEKFAELIVRECLAECWYDATPKQIADNIRQKFGVE